MDTMDTACRDLGRGILAGDPVPRITSRRPIAGVFRATAHGATTLCVRLRISPNLISLAGLTVAVAAGLCLTGASEIRVLLIVIPPLLAVRLWFNMLDGMVALAAGRANDRGWLINEATDRLSDLVIFIGVAHSGLCHPMLGYGAAIASLLTAYVGILGETIGVGRDYSGLMSKPVRMLVLCAGCFGELFHGGALGASLVLIIVGCVQTTGIRWIRIEQRLRADTASAPRRM